jgi:enoyl-CoA hydratase
MTAPRVEISIDAPAAILIIDNPPVNALHADVVNELAAALKQVAADDRVRGIIISGRGRHFVAGGDIRQFCSLDARSAEDHALRVQAVQMSLQELDRPVIAAVNGSALGGGCELMMACDIRVAEVGAVFGQPEVRLGIMPGAGGTQNLPRLMSVGRAKRMLFTGARITAREALDAGLIDEVVEAGQAVATARAIIGEVARNSPVAVAQIKRSVNLGLAMPLADALRLEAALFGDLFRTDDAREGLTAFVDKRQPQFKGR